MSRQETDQRLWRAARDFDVDDYEWRVLMRLFGVKCPDTPADLFDDDAAVSS